MHPNACPIPSQSPWQLPSWQDRLPEGFFLSGKAPAFAPLVDQFSPVEWQRRAGWLPQSLSAFGRGMKGKTQGCFVGCQLAPHLQVAIVQEKSGLLRRNQNAGRMRETHIHSYVAHLPSANRHLDALRGYMCSSHCSCLLIPGHCEPVVCSPHLFLPNWAFQVAVESLQQLCSSVTL